MPLEDVQYLAGHADPWTTRIYDRRQRTVTRELPVEAWEHIEWDA
jgi:integrase/recombinase XerD